MDLSSKRMVGATLMDPHLPESELTGNSGGYYHGKAQNVMAHKDNMCLEITNYCHLKDIFLLVQTGYKGNG